MSRFASLSESMYICIYVIINLSNGKCVMEEKWTKIKVKKWGGGKQCVRLWVCAGIMILKTNHSHNKVDKFFLCVCCQSTHKAEKQIQTLAAFLSILN